MKKILTLLTALLLVPLATVAPLATLQAAETASVASADYYVVADGNDSNSGTILPPFATIEKARLAVQSRIATGMGYEGALYDNARRNKVLLRPTKEVLEKACKPSTAEISLAKAPSPHFSA